MNAKIIHNVSVNYNPYPKAKTPQNKTVVSVRTYIEMVETHNKRPTRANYDRLIKIYLSMPSGQARQVEGMLVKKGV
jgi:hypothetical protein